jgi:hypothetical protein
MTAPDGGKVDATVIIALAVFGALAATLVVLSRRQGIEQRNAMERFAAGHGGRFLGRDASQLLPLLEQVDASESWSVYDIVALESPPAGAWLFGYNSHPRQRPSSREYGYACLAEAAGGGNDNPVFIHRRVSLVEKLEGDQVDAGTPEFRREYTVTCGQPVVAMMAVNGDVQKILLEHAASPQWYLLVRITGRRVLVTTGWAQKPEEWDYLVTLTRRLRAAIR